MADVVAKLQVDSSQFDQRLKSAVEQMNKMEKEVRRTGATFAYADKEEIAFIQSLGSMETKTSSAKSQLREYTEALMQMTSTYRNLTQEEKNSDWGKALAASMDEIKGKAAMLRDAMADVNREIGGMASDTQVFDQIAGGVTGLVSVFQVGQGALQMFGVKNQEAMQAMARLQGAMAVTNGLTKIGTLLQKQSALMIGITTVQRKAAAAAENLDTAAKGKNIVATTAATAAQKVLNAVAKANPYVLLAMAVAGVTAALFGLARSSNSAADAEEKAKDAAEDRKEAYKNVGNTVGNVVAQYKLLQTEWQNLSSETEKETWIKKNSDAFKQLGLNISDVVTADRAFVTESQNVLDALQKRAMATAMSDLYQQEVKKAYEEVFENLSTKAYLTEEAPKSVHSKNIEAYGLIEGEDYSLSRSGNSAILTESGAQKVREVRISTYLEKQLAKRIDKIQKLYGVQLVKALDEAEEAVGATDLVSDLPQGTSAPDPQKTLSLLEQRNERIKTINKSIEELNGVLASTAEEETKAWATQQLKQYQSELDRLNGKVKEVQNEKLLLNFSEKGIANLGNQIRGNMSPLEIGSGEYLIAAENLLDFTTFQNLLKAATERGIQPDPEWMASLFEDIKIGADVAPETWQAVVDSINQQIAAISEELPTIELNVKTGGVKEVKNEMSGLADNVNGAISAFGQLGSAIQQIEDPSAKIAGIIMGAIAEVAASFAASLKSNFTTWDWIAASIAGTATMISTISAIKSVTSGNYASGGKIPGNSFSGDNMRGIMPNGDLIGLDAGEVILNRAQQGAIAGQLQSNPMNDLHLGLEVDGTKALIWLNNTNRQRGGSRSFYTERH